MVGVTAATFLSVLAVSLLGFIGVLTLVFSPLRRHGALVFIVAMAAGTLLGDAIFHLLPEAVEAWEGFPLRMGLVVLGGFFVFFLFETWLRRTHAHGEEAHPHDPVREAGHTHLQEGVKPFGWVNLLSDGLHNLVDGALIAAAYLVDFRLGVATTIAVAVHEVPTEFGDFGILLRSGMRPRRVLLYNLASALTAVAGAALVLLLPLSGEPLELYGVPLIAGGFVYIAAADLVPELHHHTSERGSVMVILAGFLVGVAAMVLLLGFE